jgi:hypothetical protein
VQLLQARARRTGASGALAAFTEAFAKERQRIAMELRAAAADPAFQEAIVWQNRRAFKNSVEPLLEVVPDDTSSDTRKREMVVASYLQRYCLKNDTIGFFGPVGWGRFTPSSEPIDIACGPGIIATRDTCFEAWCIDTVATMLDREKTLRAWKIPRLQPFVRVEGLKLMMATRTVRELAPDLARLAAACTGDKCAHDIAQSLRFAGVMLLSEEEIYDMLEDWQSAGYILWSFEGPRERYPERTLRKRLARIEDPAPRANAMSALDAIEQSARAIRAAIGDAHALERAIEGLETTFTQVTGVAPTRREGEMYAARTLVYEDCRRDMMVNFGADVLGKLGPPLSLLLQSLRWSLYEISQLQDLEFRQTFDELAKGTSRKISLSLFLSKLSLVGASRESLSRIGELVCAELQQRWNSILQPPLGARHIEYRCREIRPAVLKQFSHPNRIPFSWTRTLSPDVMIDADGPEAIQRGDYRFVIGEIHAVNTLQQHLFVENHPQPTEILRSLDLDYPEPRVIWLTGKDLMSHRVHYAALDKDLGYTTTREPSSLPAERMLRAGDMEVVDDRGALMVQSRDGALRFSCLEFFGCLMARSNVNVFEFLPSAPHRPRITIDDVVVCREQWRIPAREIAFATLGNDMDRFLQCQHWVNQHALPQFVFMKMPTEVKPSYVDFASPVFVDLFARSVRVLQRTNPDGVVTLTEMLPAHSGCWLVDAEGQRYTSELRIVAVTPGEVSSPDQVQD